MRLAGGLFALGLAVSVCFIIITAFLFSQGWLRLRAFLLWEFFFSLIAILSIAPRAIDWIAGLLGVGVRGLFVVAVGLLVSYGLIYLIGLAHTRNAKITRQLAQEVALLQYQLTYLGDDYEGHRRNLGAE